MSETEKRNAWADFWHDEPSGRSGGCLSGAGNDLGDVLERSWQRFATALPRRACVLDLATGDGVVLKRLRRARPDLRLTGVDSAQALPPPPAGISLKAGVALENLPFQNEAFDALTSQFGYEYGATAEGAREVARVLKPAGRLLFVVHRHPSPVVQHNRARAAALRWAIFDSGILEKARSLAIVRRTAAIPTPAMFKEAPAQALGLFPQQGVAAEIMQAIVHSLDPRSTPEASLSSLSELERKARFELTRIDALAAAARDDSGIERLANELRNEGLDVDTPGSVADRHGQAFAWLVEGRRPAHSA